MDDAASMEGTTAAATVAVDVDVRVDKADGGTVKGAAEARVRTTCGGRTTAK